MSINRVVISGNLTRDAEMRTTQGGMQILGFGLAVNDRRKNQQTGQWEDYANFVDCTMFGNRAEKMSQFLRKGLKVVVEGRLHYSSWEKDGQKRSKLEVVVDDIDLMSRRDGTQQTGYAQSAPQPAPQYARQQPTGYAQPMPQPAPQYAQQPMPQPAARPAPQPAPQHVAAADDAVYEDIPF